MRLVLAGTKLLLPIDDDVLGCQEGAVGSNVDVEVLQVSVGIAGFEFGPR
jgi:hypothetical protein